MQATNLGLPPRRSIVVAPVGRGGIGISTADAGGRANAGRLPCGMKFLEVEVEVEGLGPVSRVGLGGWQFGSREWGYGDGCAAGAAHDIVAPGPGSWV